MLRAIRRMKLDKAPCARKPRKPKPYQRADYTGQKIQVDVKFVPNYCVADGKNTINTRQLTSVQDFVIGKCTMSTAHIFPKTF